MRLTLAALFITIASPALAGDFYFKPYVGASYDFVRANYKNGGERIANDNLSGGDIHIGARIHKYLGFEGSYLWTPDATKDNVLGTGINTKVNVQGAALDAMGYLPVLDSGKAELIATAGVSRLKAKFSLGGVAAGSGSEWETKGRVGGGAQYWVTEHANVRGLVRYQGASFSDALANAWIYSLGLNWQF